MLRSHVGEIGKLAASVVDGDLHRELLEPDNFNQELYDRAISPLVRFHSANPDIFYVYTMAERDGVPYFLLDTAASPDLRTNHDLRASDYMEAFELDEDDDGQWLRDLAAGKTYVSPDFEADDYGNFLTAHVPIYDSQGRYSGFVGVDFDTEYYLTREARFHTIAVGTFGAALILALIIGYLAARYYTVTQWRIRQLHDNSIRDSLTGFLNRDGVRQLIEPKLELSDGKSALIIVDIDNLKMINDLRGHVTGDAVITRASEAIRECVREGAECARIGDELIIFAPDCDLDTAMDIARRILVRLSAQEMPIAGAAFTVSVGIATHEGAGADFAKVYRDAESALQQARAEERERVAVLGPSTAGAFQSGRIPSAGTVGERSTERAGP